MSIYYSTFPKHKVPPCGCVALHNNEVAVYIHACPHRVWSHGAIIITIVTWGSISFKPKSLCKASNMDAAALYSKMWVPRLPKDQFNIWPNVKYVRKCPFCSYLCSCQTLVKGLAPHADARGRADTVPLYLLSTKKPTKADGELGQTGVEIIIV